MRAASSFTLRGAHVLSALLLFFAAIIAINVAFAVMAVRTFPGEDERRSYTQGLRYNDVLRERRVQAALGWRVRSQLSQGPDGARLLVRVEDRAGAPVDGATVSGVLRWAPSEAGDRALTFMAMGRGAYAAELGALASGRWDLRARAEDEGGQALDFEAELTWPSPP